MLSLNIDELLILGLVQIFLLIIIFFVAIFFFRKHKHKKKIALLIVLFINFALIPAINGNSGLITDKQMITHFYKYQHELETLMEEYLTNPDEFGSFRSTSSELKEMKKKAAIDRMVYKNSHWHKNPYSLEAARKYRADVKSRKIDKIKDRSRQDVYISVTLTGARIISKGKRVYKEFLYIPQIAKVEDNKLIYPISTLHPERIDYENIAESLDQVPEWLEPWQCIMKRINEHWFLALCKSA